MVIFSVKSKPKKIRRTNVYKKSKKQYKKAIEYSSSTSEEGAKLNWETKTKLNKEMKVIATVRSEPLPTIDEFKNND